MEAKIKLVHPAGKKGISMNKDKYEVLKQIIISQLKIKGESTHSALLDAVEKELKKNRTKLEGSVGWNMEWVKLDLESQRIIKRIKTTPSKFALVH